MTMRIGLTQHVMDLVERGERRDTLDQAWATLIRSLGATPVPIPNLVDDPVAFTTDLGIDLVVLTGGNDLGTLADASQPAPERDRLERALIDHAVGGGLALLGVCRGLQHLVLATGGSLARVGDHARTTHPISPTPGAWPLGATRTVNSFHTWGVTRDALGPVLEPLATAADGTVEAAAVPDRPVVGIMWHPERGAISADDRALLTHLMREAGR